MSNERFTQIPRMLQQIFTLSHDPDAADLVQSGLQFAAALEPLMVLSQVVSRQEGETPPGIRQLMLLPVLMPLILQQNGQSAGQNPLSERAMSRLPKTVLDASAIEKIQKDEGESVCAICYEDYAVGKTVVNLPCGHFFCVDCCFPWLRQNGSCPVCRKEVAGEDEDDREESRGWHSDDLFPHRSLPQGSPLTAVRRARAAGELWPPMDDMARIAEQHSSFQRSQLNVPSVGSRREERQSASAMQEYPESNDVSGSSTRSNSRTTSNSWRSRASSSNSSRMRILPRIASSGARGMANLRSGLSTLVTRHSDQRRRENHPT